MAKIFAIRMKKKENRIEEKTYMRYFVRAEKQKVEVE